jgi:DNA-binding response OmpR family regulator
MTATEQPSITVLLVEDDAALASMLVDRLRATGYRVWHAEDAHQAEAMAGEIRPDLYILDLMLPDAHGLVLCANLREQSSAPIIICSATKRREDAVLAFKLGAVDFMPKPFSVDELEFRLEVALQRSQAKRAADSVDGDIQSVGPLRVEHARRRVLLGEDVIQVTPTEYHLLCVLIARPNAVISRQELAERVWGIYDKGISNSLEVHLRRLRGKLKRGRVRPPALVAVRGFGYQLAWEPGDGVSKSVVPTSDRKQPC